MSIKHWYWQSRFDRRRWGFGFFYQRYNFMPGWDFELTLFCWSLFVGTDG